MMRQLRVLLVIAAVIVATVPLRASDPVGVYCLIEKIVLEPNATAPTAHLMNGHFSRFTTDKLLDFLKRLDRKVTIKIGPHKRGEPYQVIGFAS